MPIDGIRIRPAANDFVIAADAGMKALVPMGLSADLVVGDFDSLGYRPKIDNIVVHPVEKDDTDTLLAIKEGLARGYQNFALLGCLGGRLDHTLANLQTLNYLASHHAQGYLVGAGKVVFLLSRESVRFDDSFAGTLSLFSVDRVADVTIRGLHYPLDHYPVTSDFPIGVSNEFTGNCGEITAHSGRIWVILDYFDGIVEKIMQKRFKLENTEEITDALDR